MKPKNNFGHIGRTQQAVIADMLVHGLSERETLEKHKVSPSRYRRWLENGTFRQELDARLESISRQAKLTAALSLPKAAARLAELINSEKDETARKACLDIIKLQKADEEAQAARKAEQDKQEDDSFKMSDAQAAKIWAIMAEPDTEPGASATGLMGGMAKSDAEPNEAERGHVTTETIPPSPDSFMSCGEWVEKYGIPQSDGWQPLKVDDDCVAQPDTNNEQPMGGMAISERSERGHGTANPEKQAALKCQREAALSIERATERCRLLARPPRGIDLSAQNQKKNLIRSY